MTNEQLNVIVDMMEDEISKYPEKHCDYIEMIRFIKHKVDEAKQQNGWKGKKKPGGWWNKEIKEDIDQRKKAPKEHTEAKRTVMEPDVLNKKWDSYREKKMEVQKMVKER